jgi:hypothetical protein
MNRRFFLQGALLSPLAGFGRANAARLLSPR